MGRVINPDSNGKQRNQLLRTIAEVLRRLGQKPEMDDDARDMVACLVFALRDIDVGIDESAQAWEKRDYWMKADELRTRWGWAGRMADQLQAIVFADQWAELPPLMIKLFPYVSDINVTKMTRKEDTWMGSYGRLISEKPPTG